MSFGKMVGKKGNSVKTGFLYFSVYIPLGGLVKTQVED